MKTRLPRHGRTYGVLEIILSVAILAVFAVPVLQLFVNASRAEKRTRMTDAAVAAAVSYMEEFHAGQTPFALSRTLGGAPDADGNSYRRTADLGGGVTAAVVIRRDSQNAGGSLYAIDISMTGSGVKEPLYRLSGLGYFRRENAGSSEG